MKILHIIPSLGIGGTEKILFEICFGTREKFSHSVLSLKGGGYAADQLEKFKIPVTRLNTPESLFLGTLASPGLLLSLRSKIEQLHPDIIHTWLSRANVVGRLAAKGLKIPIISSLRVQEEDKTYHLLVEKKTSNLADKFTVNSTALRKFAMQKIGIPKEKIVFIPNGIRTDHIPNLNISHLIKDEWFRTSEIAIGTVARLHKQKGIDIFLKAAQLVIKDQPKVKFFIAGDGPEKKRLIHLANKLEISESVKFCDWVKHPLEFIDNLSIFVLTSRWEGCPNVILEAMCLGKPIVATAVGGTTDLIEDGKEGLLIPSENVSQCAQSILKLIKNPSLQCELSSNAKIKVLQKFSMKSMLESYIKLYESLQL